MDLDDIVRRVQWASTPRPAAAETPPPSADIPPAPLSVFSDPDFIPPTAVTTRQQEAAIGEDRSASSPI
ncbi:hypothetical protein [Limnoglobus roseus]|uniref:Uncharacterized protein n=1 Tax=Limnoglobus roseus TaxID=2598579 RepID=A0A5C1AI54_9BACT|nr:hypothetical protein [Limnoglobus roseus]QEL16814.1 hypothetical protein PX52LOC_03787 [Limnoglobus roseus]